VLARRATGRPGIGDTKKVRAATMLFGETPGQAQNVAELALERMKANDVPPNPMNYTIWYSYCSGRHPDLNRTIDVLVSNNERFTPVRNEELFDQFFGAEGQHDAVREVSHEVEDITARIVSNLKQAGVDVADYGAKLAAFGDGVSEGADLGQLIEAMLRETRSAQERNSQLEEQLNTATREVQELRTHLEDVRMEALTDGLTGLFNRKHFDAQLRRDVRNAMETGDPVCLLLCDIDHFKRFNDTYGHAIGDEVIKLVARTLKQNVKGRDTPSRFGGEEFAVILPQTAMSDALTVAEQIRRKLAGKELKTKDGARSFGSVTMSLGVAEYRLGEPLPALIERADTALYAAKHAGRNRVMAEAAETAPATASAGA
jgi:diguanylate cyclase